MGSAKTASKSPSSLASRKHRQVVSQRKPPDSSMSSAMTRVLSVGQIPGREAAGVSVLTSGFANHFLNLNLPLPFWSILSEASNRQASPSRPALLMKQPHLDEAAPLDLRILCHAWRILLANLRIRCLIKYSLEPAGWRAKDINKTILRARN